MGNYLNAPSHKKRDITSLKTLRKIKTTKCFDLFNEYYHKFYPEKELSYEQFDELFSLVLNDTGKFYKRLKSSDETVNMYEAFVAMTVFSSGDFDLKLQGLFKSFDVDSGGTIDRQELLTFIFSAVNGLCKFLDLQ